jgi:Domain of unknown function (DUF6602)
MPVIEAYWEGVLQRLQAEVDVFARLVRHSGEQGRENEVALQRLLERLVPARFGVGSGLIIDRHDNYSKQTDLVVYDLADEPSVLAQTTQLIYPIESVLAAIEVKTTLRDADITDCIQKKKALLNLEPWRPQGDGTTNHPMFVVLAYDSDQSPKLIARKLLTDSDAAMRPELLCVLRYGFLAGAEKFLPNQGAGYSTGLTPLRNEEDTDWRYAGPESDGAQEPVHGRMYPVVKVDTEVLVSNPARALLLFVEALVRRLMVQQGHQEPAISEYLDEQIRRLFIVTV